MPIPKAARRLNGHRLAGRAPAFAGRERLLPGIRNRLIQPFTKPASITLC
jgi:hypothetical protein